MIAGKRSFAESLALLVGSAFVTVVLLAGVGYLPTLRLTEGRGLPSLVGGCLVAWLASCAGAVPIAAGLANSNSVPTQSILLATGIRFLVVLALVVGAVFSGWFDRYILVVWVVISYLGLLIVDSLMAIALLKGVNRN